MFQIYKKKHDEVHMFLCSSQKDIKIKLNDKLKAVKAQILLMPASEVKVRS